MKYFDREKEAFDAYLDSRLGETNPDIGDNDFHQILMFYAYVLISVRGITHDLKRAALDMVSEDQRDLLEVAINKTILEGAEIATKNYELKRDAIVKTYVPFGMTYVRPKKSGTPTI